MIQITAEELQAAWRKYRDLFGEDPHGTMPQLNAMLEFIQAPETITISLNHADLLVKAFLPLNPNKLRSATQEVRSAAIEFKSLVASAILRKRAATQEDEVR